MDKQYCYLPFLSIAECQKIISDSWSSDHWIRAKTVEGDNEEIDADRNSDILPSKYLSTLTLNIMKRKRKELENIIKTNFSKKNGIIDTFDLVKYNTGGFYIAHKDTGIGLEYRLLTIIIYLNENFDGGETCISELGKDIRPKTGHILIFPSNMLHEGKAVNEGNKFILLTWFNSIT